MVEYRKGKEVIMNSNENGFLSLLYPNAESKKYSAFENNILQSLGLSDFFSPLSAVEGFLTDSKETVLYRQETVKDLVANPEIFTTFTKCIPILKDIAELRSLSDSDSDGYLCSITEAELYITLLETLSEGILPFRDRLSGRAMKALCDKTELLTESEHYKKINASLASLTSRVRDIKSVCLAVNLDGTLRPESAGLVSFNDRKFSFSGAVERILKVDFTKGDNRCIAPLTPFSKNASDAEIAAMNIALNGALSTVFKNDFKAWKNIIRTYVLENTDFLVDLLPECELLAKAVNIINELKRLGVNLIYPEISIKEAEFSVFGLINPVTALKIGTKPVENDIKFDENAGVYIVTGPNRGGKSVMTCGVGCVFVMAQLGMPVCADRAVMSLCDNIYCHFPDGAEDTTGKGRLGEECVRLSYILENATSRSVVLLDETLSSTGSAEAAAIADEVVLALSAIGSRTVFSTHIHKLAAEIDMLNSETEKHGGRKIDSLVAEIGENGARSFKLKRTQPTGKSFASDIADKYGLSFTEIMQKRARKE